MASIHDACVRQDLAEIQQLIAENPTLVNSLNDVSGDFVDECSAETIQLKECIDNNQEYYGVLNQPPPEEEEDANNE